MSAALPLPEKRLNPFPGLRPFEPDEDYLFFGRERQTDELLRRLRTARFLSILGTSGSGKSSLVRSGLIPALYGGGMTSAGSRWRVAIMRPGDDPLANLAAALSAPGALGENGGEDEALKQVFFETTLRASNLGIIECVREARIAPGDNVLVLVDQFEELFRYKRSRREAGRDDAAAFVKLLLAARESDAPIYIALTMRSDFIGDCMEFAGLPEVINDGVYLVSRMNRDELRSAITGPVAVGGATIAPRLVSRLLNDVGDDPDQLPILQHALMRTWEAWTVDHEPGEPLDLRHYESVGTMHTALSRHAEEAFSELNGNQQLIAEKMFKALTDKESDVRGVRRPVSMREICAISGATTGEIAAVVDRFRCDGRTFLMPPSGTPLVDESIIDISHESLMRVWTRLAQWTNEESQSAQHYLRVARAAERHEEGSSALWRDPELQLALAWRRKEEPTEAWAARYDPSFIRAMTFLDASREERDRNALEKERRRRALAMILAIASIVIAIVGIWAFREKRQAGIAQTKADKATEQAKQLQAAVKISEAAVRHSEKHALEQTIRARDNEREAKAQSEKAAQQTKTADEQTRKAKALLAEAERLARIQEAHALALDIAQGSSRRTAEAALKAERLNRENGGRADDADIFNAMLLTLVELQESNGGIVDKGGGVLRRWKGTDVFRSLVIAPDGRTAFAGGDDGNLVTFEVDSEVDRFRQVGNFPGGVRALAVRGTTLAVGTGKGRVFLRDLGDPTKAGRELDAGAGVVTSLAFRPEGQLLAAGSSDGFVRLWNVDDGSPRGEIGGPGEKNHPINHVLFVVNNQGEETSLAVATQFGFNMLDPVELKWESSDSEDDNVDVRSLAYSPSSTPQRMALGLKDGHLAEMTLGDDTPTVVLIGHRSSVNSITYNGRGDVLLSSSSDGSVRVWDISKKGEPPIVLSLKLDGEEGDLKDAVNQSEIWSAAFVLNGERVLSAGKEAWLWPANTKVLAKDLCTWVKDGSCGKSKR